MRAPVYIEKRLQVGIALEQTVKFGLDLRYPERGIFDPASTMQSRRDPPSIVASRNSCSFVLILTC